MALLARSTLRHLQFWVDSLRIWQNDHPHERVCRTLLHLNLTYIFQVIQLWLYNEPAKNCPLCSTYSSVWILPIFGTNGYYHEVCRTVTLDLDLYIQSYLAVTLPVSWIIYICSTNTSHEGKMCQVPFPGHQVKVKVTQFPIFAIGATGILVNHRSTISSFYHCFGLL